MPLVPEEISFSGKLTSSVHSSLGSTLCLHVCIDYLGINAALFEWTESYDSKVRLPMCVP